MEISGRIIQILPEETGEGRNGPWKKQNFILETQEQYPKKVCITVWGDKVDLKSFAPDDAVTASINIESREYNGRWYTDVKAWRVVKSSVSSDLPGLETPPPETAPPDYLDTDDSGSGDDLPF
jgi:hypothetical protein